MTGKVRANLSIGDEVQIVLKAHQSSGILTDGRISRILTHAPTHPHGIKVQLDTGEVGRVKKVAKI
jgi:uncharacterized repeat protein (TIGR03833 family)